MKTIHQLDVLLNPMFDFYISGTRGFLMFARGKEMGHWREMGLNNRTYFRQAGHACGMNEKGYTLVNLGQLEDEAPLTACKFKVFRAREYQETF